MRAIGYVRVSTEKQADFGVSLEAQAEKVRAMAVVQGVELVDVIVRRGRIRKIAEPSGHGAAHVPRFCRCGVSGNAGCRLFFALPNRFFIRHARILLTKNRAWFEWKVAELKADLEKLPADRQEQLKKELEEGKEQ